MRNDVIRMAHGSGGLDTAELMRDVFSKHFGNEVLDRLEDSAVVDLGTQKEPSPLCPKAETQKEPSPLCSKVAVSTDSFVVTPLVFPGGDIGKLAVCGTVNDVLMSGAEPRYLTCGFIIETGLSIPLLDDICASLAAAAEEAGVMVVAGDTKVIEGHGGEGGLMINTTGIGMVHDEGRTPLGIRPGDAVIVSGNLGDHHAAILSARMGIKNSIASDCALLTPIILALRGKNIRIHAMRDVTRGGLGTVLNELAIASGVSVELEEELIPVSRAVRAFCGMMGLDPLYMGNEGKLVLAVPAGDAERALAAMRGTEIGRDAALIGTASAAPGFGKEVPAGESGPSCGQSAHAGNALSGKSCIPVTMRTRIGGTVRVDVLYGEGLPRIC